MALVPFNPSTPASAGLTTAAFRRTPWASLYPRMRGATPTSGRLRGPTPLYPRVREANHRVLTKYYRMVPRPPRARG